MHAYLTKRFVACCLFILIGTAPASAAVATFTNRVLWATALWPTVETLNWYITEIPFAVPLSVGAFTISMTGTPVTDEGRNAIDLPPPQFSQFSVDGTNIANVLTEFGDSLFLTFDSPVTSFGADLAAFNNDFVRTRIVVGNDVMTPEATFGDSIRFFGLVSDAVYSGRFHRG